jgi:hypothetical protein
MIESHPKLVEWMIDYFHGYSNQISFFEEDIHKFSVLSLSDEYIKKYNVDSINEAMLFSLESYKNIHFLKNYKDFIESFNLLIENNDEIFIKDNKLKEVKDNIYIWSKRKLNQNTIKRWTAFIGAYSFFKKQPNYIAYMFDRRRPADCDCDWMEIDYIPVNMQGVEEVLNQIIDEQGPFHFSENHHEDILHYHKYFVAVLINFEIRNSRKKDYAFEFVDSQHIQRNIIKIKMIIKEIKEGKIKGKDFYEIFSVEQESLEILITIRIVELLEDFIEKYRIIIEDSTKKDSSEDEDGFVSGNIEDMLIEE